MKVGQSSLPKRHSHNAILLLQKKPLDEKYYYTLFNMLCNNNYSSQLRTHGVL